MARKKKIYTKLPGSSTSLTARHSLWLGTDHLLSILSTGYTEDYRRFHYEDIQALTATETTRGMVSNLILGIPAFLFLAAAVSFILRDKDMSVIFIIMAGFFFLFLAINVLMGPTCKVLVHTQVQTAELPSLRRTRKAMKALDRIRARVESVQGALARELPPEPSPEPPDLEAPPPLPEGEGPWTP